MGLKIKRTDKKRPLEYRQAKIWSYIHDDEFLRQFFRKNHPLLKFTPVHVSDVLTFRVAYTYAPEDEMTCAVTCFNLQGNYPDIIQQDQMKSTFYASLRAFLFWHTGQEIEQRQSLLLVNESGEIQWSAVEKFVLLALGHLPFDVTHNSDDNAVQFVLHPKPVLGAAPLAFTMQREGISKDYGAMTSRLGLFNVNEALRDQILIQLSHTVLNLMSIEQARQFLEDQDRTPEQRKVLEGARAVLETMNEAD